MNKAENIECEFGAQCTAVCMSSLVGVDPTNTAVLIIHQPLGLVRKQFPCSYQSQGHLTAGELDDLLRALRGTGCYVQLFYDRESFVTWAKADGFANLRLQHRVVVDLSSLTY